MVPGHLRVAALKLRQLWTLGRVLYFKYGQKTYWFWLSICVEERVLSGFFNKLV